MGLVFTETLGREESMRVILSTSESENESLETQSGINL